MGKKSKRNKYNKNKNHKDFDDGYDLEPFTKPNSRKTKKRASKTFKGAMPCPQCGEISFIRMKGFLECNSCGYYEENELELA